MINNITSFIISATIIVGALVFVLTGCVSKKPIKQPTESETSTPPVEPISLLTQPEQATIDIVTPTHTFGALIGFVVIVVAGCVIVPKLINFLRNR